jgi:YidC/Oxa1 family membrane protein insertase
MKKMQGMQKKLAYIEQKYKHDPERLRKEKAELISKHGMPGLGGCLPLFAQLPIFFALSRVLTNSLELYKAPFLWVCDLSAPDPYYILPIVIALSMIFQGLSSGEGKQQFISLAMALVFGAFSARFSAGLCLYIIVGTLFFAIQTFLQEKMKKA